MLISRIISLLLSISIVDAVSSKVYIDNQNRVIRDKDGRHTIFHGVNVVYKVAPYIPGVDSFDAQESLSDKDIDDLVSWGMNFVRLGVMWEAVETAPGVYNETYIQEVNDLINRLGAKGIYTLLTLTRMCFPERSVVKACQTSMPLRSSSTAPTALDLTLTIFLVLLPDTLAHANRSKTMVTRLMRRVFH